MQQPSHLKLKTHSTTSKTNLTTPGRGLDGRGGGADRRRYLRLLRDGAVPRREREAVGPGRDRPPRRPAPPPCCRGATGAIAVELYHWIFEEYSARRVGDWTQLNSRISVQSEPTGNFKLQKADGAGP